MKKNYSQTLLFILSIILVTACSTARKGTVVSAASYLPVSQDLYDTILHLDSIFFDAYNNCKLENCSAMISDDIEFYHDKGGLSTSKKDIMDGLRNNICGKVTRELVKGSIEVYPINNYGAVQIGLHKFHNNQEKPGTPSNTGKFIHTWQNKNREWKLTRIISLH